MRNSVFKIVLLLAALVAIAVGVSMLFPKNSPPVAKTFPDPNGYTALIEATKLLPSGVTGFDKLDQANLALLVEGSSNALRLARVGLSQECRQPIQFSTTYINTHMSEVAGIKALAFAFAAKSRLAEVENRPADAARSCLSGIQLGIQSARGGLLIDQMIGTATEAIASRNLKKLISRLNAQSCRETVDALEKLNRERESFQSILKTEHDWQQKYPASFRERISAFLSSRSLKPALTKAEKRFNEQQTETRRMLIDLAARAYQLEKGAPPKTVADLVPEYLKAIPKDPSTGTNMVYPPLSR